MLSMAIRTRFPPEPNGYLHIGHLKAILADFELPNGNDKVKVVCNLRYDDTNPDNETDEYKQAILDDLEWLGFKPTFITSTSDYFNILSVFVDNLLKRKEAYYDASTSEEIGKQRESNTLSPYRSGQLNKDCYCNSNSTEPDRSWCVRLKVPVELHSSTCMCDPVIMRWKGDSKCMIPTYDLSHPIVDYLEEITHSYCTREFYIRRELYYYMIKLYRTYGDFSISKDSITEPSVMEFSRLKIEGVDLSKRKILAAIKNGDYTGFDDPRLFTICGLRNRGHDAKALIHFCRKLSYVEGDGGVTPMHMFEHSVREYYEVNAIRRFGIPENKLLPVKVTNSDLLGVTIKRPNHPIDESKSKNILSVTSNLFICSDDFKTEHNKKYTRFSPKRPVWLRHYGLVECLKHENKGSLTVGLINGTLSKSFKPRPTAIQWISREHHLELEVNDPESDTQTWLLEENIPETAVFQLERCGYYRYFKASNTVVKVIGLKSKGKFKVC